MVGAIADWFAVVALFRHPLNLPIPHTAIIPSNKDRIGEKLATFICANFLSTSQVLDRIERFRAATRLANWLADPHHAEQMATHLGSALHYALGAMDDQRVRHFFRATLLDQLEKVDIARLTGQLLDVLTTDRRHQDLLDLLLRKLASVLDDETLKQRMAEIIAAEVAYLRFVGLDVAAGRYATSKIVAGVVRLVGEMADDAAHPLRLEFDGFVESFIARLKHEPELRARVESLLLVTALWLHSARGARDGRWRCAACARCTRSNIWAMKRSRRRRVSRTRRAASSSWASCSHESTAPARAGTRGLGPAGPRPT